MAQTLYERIGGAPAIQAAVDIFYNKVMADDRINHWFAHMDMQAQRKKQETFLTMAFGGPSSYTGRDMATAHQKLVERGLGDADFNAVAENLKTTLEELGVAKELIDEAMATLESTRDAVLCRSKPKTLYERIGGAPAIQAAVDIFYNKVMADDRINHWFAHMDMQAQRKKQETFLTMAFGGPSSYTGRDMATAHQKLVERGLGDADFNAVAENLKTTLEELGVAKELIDEAMATLESTRDEVLCRRKQVKNEISIPKFAEISEKELLQDGFRKFELVDRRQEEGCEDKYFRLTLTIPEGFNFKPGNHLQIGAMIDGQWVQRSYTPVSDPQDKQLELLIKLYPGGPMSQWLARVPVHSSIWIKGPTGHFSYRKGAANHINMFACGSGITPMWQILKAIANNPEDKTEVVFIHGCRHENELALRKELNSLVAKHPNIRVAQTLTHPSQYWAGIVGRISEDSFPQFNAHDSDSGTLNLLCGTDEFVVHLKKVLKSQGHTDSSIVIF